MILLHWYGPTRALRMSVTDTTFCLGSSLHPVLSDEPFQLDLMLQLQLFYYYFPCIAVLSIIMIFFIQFESDVMSLMNITFKFD